MTHMGDQEIWFVSDLETLHQGELAYKSCEYRNVIVSLTLGISWITAF